MNKKISESSDQESIDLIELFSELWRKKNTILQISIIFSILGIFYSLSIKNSFKASSVFYPHYEEMGGNSNNLKNLAGIAGINLSNENSENVPSNLYPKLINSPIFKENILNQNIIFNNDTITYKEYLLKKSSGNFLKKLIFSPIHFIKIFTSEADSQKNINNYPYILNFSEEEYSLHNQLNNKIILSLNEKEGFIELSVIDENPHVASQIAIISKNTLQENIINFKIKNIKETYDFISSQLEIAKNNFYKYQDSLAKFKDTNLNIKSDLFKNQSSRIESELNIARNIYNDLAINKEKIAIDVSKITPIFTVIKPVIVPNKKFHPQRSIIVIIFTLLGFSVSSVYIILKKPLKNIFIKIIN
tara:strand:- start:29842 stop:30924 length:1083 start_codon:yes stop_codon:yes gene_type:complete